MTLEDLIGRPLHEVGDQELEELIMKGRLAREEESTGYKAKKKKEATPKTKKETIPEFDLDELGLDDVDLDL